MNLPIRYLLLVWFCFVLESSYGCKKHCAGDYGSQGFPATSCADILKERSDDAKDGIYWITIGQSKPFPVFCNMEAGGWTLVFKLIAGISGGPVKSWTMPFPTYEYSLEALNTNDDFKHHYKNRVVQNWTAFKPSEARVVLYKSGKEEVVLRFNAANSDNVNWFSAANVLESPWQDILTAKKNYFSIGGPCYTTGCRNFHINNVYGGCPADVGWLSVGESAACSWEKRFPAGVKLIYSKVATHANYNSFSKFGAADVFAVFLR